ncbi:MAG: M23 family metallopeptidase [Chitinispirillaceae bacterium]|nr:M23 family metallopeptidase [Chitinispirillaceae bacterium]
MKSASFLIVSQNGKSVRSVKVNLFLVFIPVVFIAIGIAAYFIPQDIFRLKQAEQIQRKQLRAQNKLLHERFLSALRVLSSAKEQITKIEEQKESVAALNGTAGAGGGRHLRKSPRVHAQPYYVNVKPAALYAHFCSRDSTVSAFAALAPRGGNPFERIPVCRPVSAGAVLSRRFGMNLDPFTGVRKQHNGVDFAAPSGTPVIATASGHVSSIENSEIWGKKVVINHGAGLSTVYAHLGTVSAGRGRAVKRGAVIGTIGVSGLTSGPHVHYEVWKYGTALDPEELFFPAGKK